jgi:hypothetical protein
MLRQQMVNMATLSDLVTAVSAVTGLPEATVFAYGRFARQAGLIQQKGRGRSAAAMSIADAANLLIAIAATGVTKEAGKAIETFRSLRNGRFYDFIGGGVSSFYAMDWLKKIGIAPNDLPETHGFKIQGKFGRFFEFFIDSTLNGDLANVFKHIPVVEIPDDLWRSWKRDKSAYLEESMDELVKKGLITPKPATDLQFGEDINVEVSLSRLVPAVEIEFRRMWDGPQTVYAITFGPERGAQSRAPHDMRLIATITQHVVAAAGLVVSDTVNASAVRSYKAMDELFWNQFWTQRESRDAKRG